MSSPSQKGDDKPKPCKIWNCERKIRKSVTAVDLRSLILEGKRKLEIPEEVLVRVVLDEDGTEVDDDSYFRLLPDFSTFLLLREDLGENWNCTSVVDGVSARRMFWEPRRNYDSASGSTFSDIDAVDSGSGSKDRALILFEQLYSGSAYKQLLPWLLLRPFDLEEILHANPDNLAAAVGCDRSVVDCIQEMSARALQDYNNAQKAVQMLSIYDQAVNHAKQK